MAEFSNDHDLLTILNTKVDALTNTMSEFMKMYDIRHTALSTRVHTLEAKDKGDSEKVRALTEQLQRTLNNAERITQVYIEINAVKGEVKAVVDSVQELKKKSNLFDAVNAVMATVSGVVGYIFGGK